MRNCVIQSLLVMSLKEKAARQIDFHPRVTVIRGQNDTGKSSLMKSIYYTFGGTPPQLHPKWKEAEVCSAVRFTVNNIPHIILRNRDRYSVFDANGSRIITTSSVTKGLAPYLADLFNFKLQLQSRSGEDTQATPAFLFLPFYVDQDAGWTKNWSSFANLGQFVRWRKDVAEYHMGVRPNEYYDAKSGLAAIRTSISQLRSRRELLQTVLRKFEKEIAKVDFDIDIEVYGREIERLLVYCRKLQDREQELKRKLIIIYNQTIAADALIAIAKATEKELKADYVYAAREIPAEKIECPTCGTEHENAFVERFAIAKDEQRCKEVLVELRNNVEILKKDLAKLRMQYSGNATELQEAQALLNQKKGDVTLRQIIESEGRKEAHAIVERDISSIEGDIGKIDTEMERLERRMKMFDNKERRANIKERYFNRMKRHVSTLGVHNLMESAYKNLDAAIPESGSDLPRALLAYLFSVLQTIGDSETATVCPIVIDSPRQQDQDQRNWLQMLMFIRDNQPKEFQLILSLVDDGGIEFDGKVVDLTTKNQVLSGTEYQSVLSQMMPLLQASSED